MICKNCGFENKDEAAFCANCGKPVVAENASPMGEAPQEEEKTTIIEPLSNEEGTKPVDDSEANTTVLTNDMAMAPVSPAPQGFNNGPAPMGAPQGFNNGPAPMGAPQGFNNGPAPMGAPQGFNNGPAPMGMPMGAPMDVANNGKPAKAPKPPKAPKAPKQPKESNGKKSKGTLIYIVISVLLILGLTGVGVWGYFHYTDKIDKLEEEKLNIEAELTSEYELEITELETEISDLNSTVTDYETQISEAETEITGLEEELEAYAKYDSLIDFTGSCAGQGYSDFFCSDTMLYLTSDTAAVKVYYLDMEGTVYFECADSSVVECEWGDTWENDLVATLYVTPKATGNTTIKITNTTNDEEILIYVQVD